MRSLNFSSHYSHSPEEFLCRNVAENKSNIKQYLLHWCSSYSKSSVVRAALDPQLNRSFEFHSQNTQRNSILCRTVWFRSFRKGHHHSHTAGLLNFSIYFHFLVSKKPPSLSTGLWQAGGSVCEALTSSTWSPDKKCLALHVSETELADSQTSGSQSPHLISALQYSVSAGRKTAVTESDDLQCLLQVLLQDAAVLGWHRDDTADLKSKDGEESLAGPLLAMK